MKKYLFVALISIIIGFFLGVVVTPEKIVKESTIIEIKDTQTVTITPSYNPVITPAVITTKSLENYRKNEKVTIIEKSTIRVLNKKGEMEEIEIPELSLPKNIKNGFEIEPTDYARDVQRYVFNTSSEEFGADPFVINQLGLTPNTIFVEIGIGPGPYTFAIASKVKEYYGQDLGESSIEFVKWRMKLGKNGFNKIVTENTKIYNYDNIHLYIGEFGDAKIPVMCDKVMMHQVHAWRSPGMSKDYEQDLAKSIAQKIKRDGMLIIVEDSRINEGDRSAEETAQYLEKFSFKKEKITIIPGNTWYMLFLKKI